MSNDTKKINPQTRVYFISLSYRWVILSLCDQSIKERNNTGRQQGFITVKLTGCLICHKHDKHTTPLLN